jgi:hypothetical protein
MGIACSSHRRDEQCKIFVGNPEENKALGRPFSRIMIVKVEEICK